MPMRPGSLRLDGNDPAAQRVLDAQLAHAREVIQETGGRCSVQRSSPSSWAASARSIASSPWRPTSCMPIGKAVLASADRDGDRRLAGQVPLEREGIGLSQPEERAHGAEPLPLAGSDRRHRGHRGEQHIVPLEERSHALGVVLLPRPLEHRPRDRAAHVDEALGAALEPLGTLNPLFGVLHHSGEVAHRAWVHQGVRRIARLDLMAE